MQLSNALKLIFTSFTASGFGSIQFSSFLFVRPPLVIGMALCPAALPPPVALSENPGQAVSPSPLRLVPTSTLRDLHRTRQSLRSSI